MIGKKMNIVWSLVIAIALVLSSLSAFAAVSKGIEDEGWEVTIEEEKTTARFGGGNYTDFVFEDPEGREDARFGIIWGTEENPNSIVMVVNKMRYLGKVSMEGEVDDGNGKKEIDEERFIKIGSTFGARLGNIWEYERMEEEDVAHFFVDAGDGVDSDSMPSVYKSVNLREAAWEYSGVEESEDGDEMNWELSLTARDLPYEPLPDEELDPEMEDEVLDKIEFTFHLSASIEEVEGVEVPNFEVKIDSESSGGYRDFIEGPGLRQMERKGTEEGTATVANYEMKWDNEMVGWDFDPENEDPALLLGFQNFIGHRIQHLQRWHRQLMYRTGENIRMRTRDRHHDGEFSAEFSMEGERYERNRLERNRIEYGGNWTRTGAFSWVDTVNVDGEEKNVTAQLFGGMPWVHPSGLQLPEYFGFLVWGGINYPGGEEIIHDPSLSGDAFLDLQTESEDEPQGPFSWVGGSPRILFTALVLAAVITMVVAAMLFRGDDERSRGKNKYDKEKDSEEDNWSEYYDRQR
ncbi:MAG: hypothetical protein V5A88_06770 [Candidatus Thermoplasmatota archaeon]